MKTFLKAAAFGLLLGTAPLAMAQEAGSVNINTADLESLMELPGIGSTRAQAIIDDRDAHGNFESAADLSRISGIGDATVAGLSDKVAL